MIKDKKSGNRLMCYLIIGMFALSTILLTASNVKSEDDQPEAIQVFLEDFEEGDYDGWNLMTTYRDVFEVPPDSWGHKSGDLSGMIFDVSVDKAFGGDKSFKSYIPKMNYDSFVETIDDGNTTYQQSWSDFQLIRLESREGDYSDILNRYNMVSFAIWMDYPTDAGLTHQNSYFSATFTTYHFSCSFNYAKYVTSGDDPRLALIISGHSPSIMYYDLSYFKLNDWNKISIIWDDTDCEAKLLINNFATEWLDYTKPTGTENYFSFENYRGVNIEGWADGFHTYDEYEYPASVNFDEIQLLTSPYIDALLVDEDEQIIIKPLEKTTDGETESGLLPIRDLDFIFFAILVGVGATFYFDKWYMQIVSGLLVGIIILMYLPSYIEIGNLTLLLAGGGFGFGTMMLRKKFGKPLEERKVKEGSQLDTLKISIISIIVLVIVFYFLVG